MRPLTGSARALHRIRSGDEVTDSGSSTHSRRGGRRRSGRQERKRKQRSKQYSQNGSPPAGHVQQHQDRDKEQVVTATGHTALRIRGTARAEEDSALEQSVELMASVPHLPLPMTLARLWEAMPKAGEKGVAGLPLLLAAVRGIRCYSPDSIPQPLSVPPRARSGIRARNSSPVLRARRPPPA